MLKCVEVLFCVVLFWRGCVGLLCFVFCFQSVLPLWLHLGTCLLCTSAVNPWWYGYPYSSFLWRAAAGWHKRPSQRSISCHTSLGINNCFSVTFIQQQACQQVSLPILMQQGVMRINFRKIYNLNGKSFSLWYIFVARSVPGISSARPVSPVPQQCQWATWPYFLV